MFRKRLSLLFVIAVALLAASGAKSGNAPWDKASAEAIAEAGTRATMREVAIKSGDQQELQLLHRL